MKYAQMNRAQLTDERARLEKEYARYCTAGLNLDLSRGKPNAQQLDLCAGFYEAGMRREDCFSTAGVDCRNYGILEGIAEAREFFAPILGVSAQHILVGGNSSLQMMYDALCRAMLFGVVGSQRPWCREEGLKWICVVPGYDRHFAITEKLGFELLSVPMLADGPDMDQVEKLVQDPKVKGIWCVPKYSNPTGNTYSDRVVCRLASMKCAAPDFRIFWDNAYAIHDLYEQGDSLADIFEQARAAGQQNRIFAFASTSKITLPGAGIAAMAASEENLRQIRPLLGTQTIGSDKMNQLRHVHYFREAGSLHRHMMQLAEGLRVKFSVTAEVLDTLRDADIATWSIPRGGYFISLDVMAGTAKRVYTLMKDAGVVLTQVGATYPYGIDPQDRNLRLAPSFPTDEDLRLSMEVLVCAVRLAAVGKLLNTEKM